MSTATLARKSTRTPQSSRQKTTKLERVVFSENGVIDPNPMTTEEARHWQAWYASDKGIKAEVLEVVERADLPELFMVECLDEFGRMGFNSRMIFSYTDAAAYCHVLEFNGFKPQAYRIVTVTTLKEPAAFPSHQRPEKQTREAAAALRSILGREVKAG